jgi:hypothetical protein
MTCGLNPLRMTAEERLDEVGALLGLGLRRLKCRKQANNASNFNKLDEKPLDFDWRQSVDRAVSATQENTRAG